MQHAQAKLSSKLHLFAYVDVLAQSMCSMNSDCASKLEASWEFLHVNCRKLSKFFLYYQTSFILDLCVFSGHLHPSRRVKLQNIQGRKSIVSFQVVVEEYSPIQEFSAVKPRIFLSTPAKLLHQAPWALNQARLALYTKRDLGMCPNKLENHTCGKPSTLTDELYILTTQTQLTPNDRALIHSPYYLTLHHQVYILVDVFLSCYLPFTNMPHQVLFSYFCYLNHLSQASLNNTCNEPSYSQLPHYCQRGLMTQVAPVTLPCDVTYFILCVEIIVVAVCAFLYLLSVDVLFPSSFLFFLHLDIFVFSSHSEIFTVICELELIVVMGASQLGLETIIQPRSQNKSSLVVVVTRWLKLIIWGYFLPIDHKFLPFRCHVLHSFGPMLTQIMWMTVFAIMKCHRELCSKAGRLWSKFRYSLLYSCIASFLHSHSSSPRSSSLIRCAQLDFFLLLSIPFFFHMYFLSSDTLVGHQKIPHLLNPPVSMAMFCSIKYRMTHQGLCFYLTLLSLSVVIDCRFAIARDGLLDFCVDLSLIHPPSEEGNVHTKISSCLRSNATSLKMLTAHGHTISRWTWG
ncbi:putative signal peptide protein [Puccinia sorghi]|uniref:Putative signal peptide protein n=1 Tax=Puccinia sorghi TaxID=27349 RepID=A0A0L6VE34_9BASI|nr:putative signal peptide protein [Puccinia sorghi]